MPSQLQRPSCMYAVDCNAGSSCTRAYPERDTALYIVYTYPEKDTDLLYA